MIRRLPIFSTLVVALAIGIMLRLGFWQIDRMHEKEALLSRYAGAQGMSAEAAWPKDAAEADRSLIGMHRDKSMHTILRPQLITPAPLRCRSPQTSTTDVSDLHGCVSGGESSLH